MPCPSSPPPRKLLRCWYSIFSICTPSWQILSLTEGCNSRPKFGRNVGVSQSVLRVPFPNQRPIKEDQSGPRSCSKVCLSPNSHFLVYPPPTWVEYAHTNQVRESGFPPKAFPLKLILKSYLLVSWAPLSKTPFFIRLPYF